MRPHLKVLFINSGVILSLASHSVWPDWAIFWILGNLLKPLATINLPQLNDLNMVVAWSNHERCPGRVVDAVNLGMVLEKDWTKNKQEDVQEPWSSGYRSRLMKWRLWGRISAPYTVWTFFKLICCKKCIDVCLKMNENKQKRGREWPTFFKKSRRSIFSWKEELKAGKRFFLDQNIIINVEGWTRFIYYV